MPELRSDPLVALLREEMKPLERLAYPETLDLLALKQAMTLRLEGYICKDKEAQPRPPGETGVMVYTADSPIVREALTVWHEAGRAAFEGRYKILDYDSPDYVKTAKERRKYIALDHGTSGAFLVDKATGDVYTIKGYGVAGRRVMHISEWADYWKAQIDDNPYRLIYVKKGAQEAT